MKIRLLLALSVALLGIGIAACSPDAAAGQSNIVLDRGDMAIFESVNSLDNAPLPLSREAAELAEAVGAGDNTNAESEALIVDRDGMITVAISVGDESFTAKFYDNETSQAFLSMLPLTLDMSDLNRNEKMVYLSQNLPAAATERPSSIQAGEIKLYYQNCLVLFYESFSNSYDGYTSLGYVEDAAGLSGALGSGHVTVSLSLS